MSELDRDEIFSTKDESAYLWCLHCERAYKRGSYRTVGELQMCPYEGCDGDTAMDAWGWEKLREEHPDYPEIPEEGKLYPLYR